MRRRLAPALLFAALVGVGISVAAQAPLALVKICTDAKGLTVSGASNRAKLADIKTRACVPPSVVSLTVNAPAPTAPPSTLVGTAIAHLSDGTTQDVTAASTWLSSDSTIATVLAPGQLVGLNAGPVTLYALYGQTVGRLGTTFPIQCGVSVPATPNTPSPANGATGIATSAQTLTWSDNGTSYDVYFGTTGTPGLITNGQAGTSWSTSNFGALAANTTYFWQIVVHHSCATVSGPVWSFTTVSGSVCPGNNCYYVSTTGSDSNSCATAKNVNTPKATVNAGVLCPAAGEIVLVRAGTYAETLNDPAMTSGTSFANAVTIAAYPGNCGSTTCETVWLKPPNSPNNPWTMYFDQSQSYIVFDGIGMDYSNGNATNQMGGLNVSNGTYMGTHYNAHHIRYKNAEVIANRAAGDLASSRQGIDFVALGTDQVGGNEVVNVHIHGSGGSNAAYGFYIQSSNNLLDTVEINDMGFQCGQIYDVNSFNPTGNIIRKMKCHDITTGFDDRRNGITVTASSNTIYDCLIYNINAGGTANGNQNGIYVYFGTSAALYNNTVTANVGYGIHVETGGTSTDVENNISFNNSQDYQDSGTGTITKTNLCGSGCNLTGNPNYVNASATPPDLHVQSGSPAIDAGTTLAAVPDDLDGNPRPDAASTNPDVGAYEHSGA